MEYETILYTTEGAIATITINRPAVLNALSQATNSEVVAALAAAEADEAVRVVVITGAGERAFAAGADIGELRALPSADAARRFSEVAHQVGFAISAMHKPVIAAINGFALGGGLELAMACDMRVAASSAQVGQPEITLGIIPGWGGTQRLPRLIGPGAARLLCMTGERINADEALRLGIVERVFPVESFRNDVRKLAQTLAERPPLALAAIKQAIQRGMNMALEDGCLYEASLFGNIVATDDAKEGTNAFLEKRKATFSGS